MKPSSTHMTLNHLRFFCEAPGGLLFEFNTRSDADDAYRRTFDSQIAAPSSAA